MLTSSTSSTAPGLIWTAAGEPPHKYTEEHHDGVCATCAAPVSQGVNTTQVNNPTFSNHAEFFKFGSHVCRACAWMYGDPKRTHRNVLCVGGQSPELWWPMVSVESATEERPSWMDLLSRLLEMPPDTPMCGVLTTDPKPRMWPRMRLATLRSPGLYVHAPDYDVSGNVSFSWEPLALGTEAIRRPLLAGFSKTRIYHGLLSDYAKAKRDMAEAVEMEKGLQSVRGSPEFVVALLTTGVTKEEKAKWKERNDGENGSPRGTDGGRSPRGQADEDHPRLL